MFLNEVKTLHNNVAVAGDGVVTHDFEWRSRGDNVRDETTLEVAVSGGAPTFSVQPKQSPDGTTWYDVGAAISAAGLTRVTGITAPFFKAEVLSVAGGNITVRAM